jgi:alkanesulfonate monooxygenase
MNTGWELSTLLKMLRPAYSNHDSRYELTDEFLSIWRREMEGETVDFVGDYLNIKAGKVLYAPMQAPYPALYFGGSSPIAQKIAVNQSTFI